MFNLHSILAAFAIVSVAIQPVVASETFNEKEMAACATVGKIAIKISKLQAQGLKRKFIEAGLKEELDESLSLWVKPISRLVFSRQEQSPEKVVKKVIGYCLHTMKMHKKMPKMASINT
ncbi:MAG: hypothetical protein L3J59_12685 [Methylococcaceae bacterium]|nr:hypothetical protein [Methylococcaceae bacterium]